MSDVAVPPRVCLCISRLLIILCQLTDVCWSGDTHLQAIFYIYIYPNPTHGANMANSTAEKYEALVRARDFFWNNRASPKRAHRPAETPQRATYLRGVHAIYNKCIYCIHIIALAEGAICCWTRAYSFLKGKRKMNTTTSVDRLLVSDLRLNFGGHERWHLSPQTTHETNET